jgi:glycosyltransferase involved in cell wall biosynthesis
MKCLWIARDLPFPLDAGDRIYSANMARSLGEAGAYVRFLGYRASMTKVPSDWPVDGYTVIGDKHGPLRALFSRLPIAAAIHDTPYYRALLEMQLRQMWDVIVLDSYGSGWALDVCIQARNSSAGKKPALVYLSHNHEGNLWRAMARESKAALPKKVALWQNYRKVQVLERRLVAAVDLIATITAEDAQAYAAQDKSKPMVVLTPGYSGWIAPEREINEDCPSRVVLVGSFRWVVKQENLRRFLEQADMRFAQQGIRFDVIGDVPQALLDELRPMVRATEFHGFVDDIGPFFSAARMAVVPEMIGGGFKLKYLDYIFGRVPVASISAAAMGLPEAIRANMLCRQDVRQLVDAIVESIGRPRQLNAMQQRAFAEARTLFQWRDRGLQLRHALEALT